MAVFLGSVLRAYNHLLDKADHRLDGKLIMDSPALVAGIAIGYYYFVTVGGRKLMENRKPFQLTNTMIVYNAAQSLINLLMFCKGIVMLWHFDEPLTCIEMRYGDDYFTKETVKLTHIFLLLKLSDLIDTIFMVLRKNYHQISFLHVYHHLGMFVGSWIVARYLPGGHPTIFGLINTFVHFVMYLYYLVAAKNPEIKKSLWIKKKITQLQMIQFALILFHLSLAFFNPSCGYPKLPTFIFMTQNLMMIYLFSKFYYRTYIKPKKIVRKETLDQPRQKGE